MSASLNVTMTLDLESSVKKLSEGVDALIQERADLLAALQNVVDAAATDSDTCSLCGRDLLKHDPDCAIVAAMQAIEKAGA